MAQIALARSSGPVQKARSVAGWMGRRGVSVAVVWQEQKGRCGVGAADATHHREERLRREQRVHHPASLQERREEGLPHL